MLPCAVWHTVADGHLTKTIKPSVESSSRPTDDAHNRPHPWPTTRRRSESRRDMDVCPPTVPIRNLDIFRSRTSIWVLSFCVRATQNVRRHLANFFLKKSSLNIWCILNLSQWYVHIYTFLHIIALYYTGLMVYILGGGQVYPAPTCVP